MRKPGSGSSMLADFFLWKLWTFSLKQHNKMQNNAKQRKTMQNNAKNAKQRKIKQIKAKQCKIAPNKKYGPYQSGLQNIAIVSQANKNVVIVSLVQKCSYCQLDL